MAEPAKVRDSFGTFLDSVKKGSVEPESPRSRVAEGQITPMEVLTVLGEHGPMPVDELRAALGRDIVSFSSVLPKLVAAELVLISGSPGQETIELTGEGSKFALLTDLG